MEFAARFPALLHRSGAALGYPLTWAHYVQGMANLNRAAARGQIRDHDAATMAATTDRTARRTWLDELRERADWL